MLRPLVAAPGALVVTLLFSLPTILAGLVDPSGRAAHAVIRLWARIVLELCGIRVGLEDRSGHPDPAVYAANHSSALDIPILFAHLPVGFRIIYKRSLSLIPFVGWCLAAAGHVAIDRGNAFSAKRSLERAAARIRGGTSVAVFPEGTRSPDAEVRHFKRGSFSLAIQAGAPVVPVSLVGVRQLAPGGLASLRPGEVRLRLHPPLTTLDRDPDRAAELAEDVRRIVADGCKEVA